MIYSRYALGGRAGGSSHQVWSDHVDHDGQAGSLSIIISMSKYVNLSGSARDVICSAGSGPTSVVVCVEWCGVRRFSFRFRLAGGG